MPEANGAATLSPRMVELNTSNVCNLRCSTCVRSWDEFEQPAPVFLTLAQFDAILNRFPGLPKLQICGFSEPTLNKNVPAMIRHAKAMGVQHVEMFTNATLLVGDIAQRLAKSGLDLLRVSIDRGDPETYRRIRGADLQKVTHNVHDFAEKSGIPVRMESVLSKYAFQSADKLPDVAHAAGATSLAIRLLDGQDSDVGTHSVYDPDYLAGLKKRLMESCKALGIELIMALPGEEDFPSRCTAWDEVYVDEQGGVVPCYLLKDRVAGNLLETPYEVIQQSQRAAHEEERESNGGFLQGCCCNWALLALDRVSAQSPQGHQE